MELLRKHYTGEVLKDGQHSFIPDSLLYAKEIEVYKKVRVPALTETKVWGHIQKNKIM